MAWIPDGYVHIRRWLEDEVERRSKTWFDGHRRAFNDLADFMAQEWTVGERFALHVYDSGFEPDVIPLWRWRQAPNRRSELALRRFGDSNSIGYVAIWRNLRLDMKAGDRQRTAIAATDATSKSQPRAEAPSKRVIRENNINAVILAARRVGAAEQILPTSRTGHNKLASLVHKDTKGRFFKVPTIKRILAGTYKPQIALGIPGYFLK